MNDVNLPISANGGDACQKPVFLVFVGKSHIEPNFLGRIDGIAPTGYGIKIAGALTATHWGWGGERSTEAMFAHALVRAAEKIFIECETPTIHVVTRKIGTDLYLREHVPKWRKEAEAISKDNLKLWEHLHALALLGDLEIRKPGPPEERALCKEAHRLAEEAAQSAFGAFQENRLRFATAGVYVTDDDPGA